MLLERVVQLEQRSLEYEQHLGARADALADQEALSFSV